MGVGGRRRRCPRRSRSGDTDEQPGELAGGGRGCSRTAGLEASGRGAPATSCSGCVWESAAHGRPLRRREAKLPGKGGGHLASPRPAGLRSWGNTSTSRTRNWKSENRADSPQGSRQLHGARRPPALPSRGCVCTWTLWRGKPRRAGPRGSHTSPVHCEEHDDPEAPSRRVQPASGHRASPAGTTGTAIGHGGR